MNGLEVEHALFLNGDWRTVGTGDDPVTVFVAPRVHPARYQAVGKGGVATFLLVARQVIIFAPIVIILPLIMGLDGVWISLPIADILILILTSILVIREFTSLRISS